MASEFVLTMCNKNVDFTNAKITSGTFSFWKCQLLSWCLVMFFHLVFQCQDLNLLSSHWSFPLLSSSGPVHIHWIDLEMERLFAIHLDIIQENSESPHLKVYLKSLIDLDLDLVAIRRR